MINLIAKSNFDKLEKMKKQQLSKEQIKEAHANTKQKTKTKELTR